MVMKMLCQKESCSNGIIFVENTFARKRDLMDFLYRTENSNYF